MILTERDFQLQVVQMARLFGWETFHVRAGRTLDSWRTPGSGSMAAGWPDLVLVHPVRRRLLFVELKTDTGKLTAHQERVLDLLRLVAPVHVWRPAMWNEIEATLRSSKEEAA